jgi:hypothetical protein
MSQSCIVTIIRPSADDAEVAAIHSALTTLWRIEVSRKPASVDTNWRFSGRLRRD